VELSDMMLTAMEAQKSNGSSAIKDSINATLSSSGSPEESGDPSAGPTVQTYLYDSFQAYDTDKSGKLDQNEFFELLTTLNLGLSDADIEQLKVKTDILQY
jgi:hypothetical protein